MKKKKTVRKTVSSLNSGSLKDRVVRIFAYEFLKRKLNNIINYLLGWFGFNGGENIIIFVTSENINLR